MKTIGIIGGMGWEASALYYQRINEIVHQRLANMASAEIVLHSLNNKVAALMMYRNQWDQLAELIQVKATQLETAGAECIAIACNSAHHIANQLKLDVPLLHIADAVGEEAKCNNHQSLMLLGTKFTCSMDFYARRLESFGVEVKIPSTQQIDKIHKFIYTKLKTGDFSSNASNDFLAICQELSTEADGLILGCTELPLLVKEETDLVFYDTIELHCQQLANWSLR